MNIYFCLIIFICGISCKKYDEKLQTQGNESFDSGYGYKRNEGYQRNISTNNSYGFNRNTDDRYYVEEYIGNPVSYTCHYSTLLPRPATEALMDERVNVGRGEAEAHIHFDAIIERPCRVFDLNCIRKYFAEHSKCKIRRGPLPRNLIISQESQYFAGVNLTLIPPNLRIGGIRSSRIEEFYLNRRTNNVVFSINIRGLSTIPASGSYLEFFRNRREPIVIVSQTGQVITSVTFTAIIPYKDGLRLDKAEITAYVDAVPIFTLGLGVLNNTDPTVVQSLAGFFADTSTDTQEFMLTDSQYYLPAYIQYNICDFGLKVIKIIE